MVAVSILALAIALVFVLLARVLASDQGAGPDHHAEPDRDGSSSTAVEWDDGAHAHLHDMTVINPATGLPMIDGIGSVDVAGNPYAVDLQAHSAFGAGPFETGPGLGNALDDWASTGIGHYGDAGFGDHGSTGSGFGGSPFD